MRTARNYHEAEMLARSALLFRYGRCRFEYGWRLYSEKFIARGECVYVVNSYGGHFPCAIAFFADIPRYDANPRVTFFNIDKYSRTTTRHMGVVTRAFGGGRSGQTVHADRTVMTDLLTAILQENATRAPEYGRVREEFVSRAQIKRKQNELDEYNAGLHRAISRIVQGQPMPIRHTLIQATMADANVRLMRKIPVGET